MTKYARHVNKRATSQRDRAHAKQRRNNATGFSFVVDDWARLDRFLILGSEDGTYYVSERALTRQNASCVERCLDQNGLRAVKRIVEISDTGRAPKNDAAIFALALAASHSDAAVRKAALDALPKVCRIGTHLFQFAESIKGLRGWGRGLRKAVAAWYDAKSSDQLAYQVAKYQQRSGWSHRDMMRVAHATPKHQAIARWVVGAELGERQVKRSSDGADRMVTYDAVGELPEFLVKFEELRRATNDKHAARLIREHGFTHEMVPTELKGSTIVWDALLERMPMTAMLRNLGKMTHVGLLEPRSAASRFVIERLGNREALAKARVHPVAVLVALKIYRQGHGLRGSLKWAADTRVVDALDSAFYAAFQHVEATGKKMLLALDVSGSMSWGSIAGMPLMPSEAAAAMAMVTAKTEADWHVMAFAQKLRELPISPRQRLDDVLRTTRLNTFGGTDCALPMVWAAEHKVAVDAFAIYTDNETWAGNVHPHQALELYRQKMGRDAKLVVTGMTSTGFSIANPDDAGMLDVVGFDTASPDVISSFVRA